MTARVVAAIAVLLGTGLTPAIAEDIPLPMKKPRDSHGQPLTKSALGAAPTVNDATASKSAKTKAEARSPLKETAAPPERQAVAQDKSPPGNRPAPETKASEPATGTSKAAPSAGWPKTLPDAKAEAEAKANPKSLPITWSDQEIADGKALCKTILAKIDAVTLPENPFRQGECGTPAPVRVISIGRDPEVSVSPPAVLTCGMVGALHTWVTKDLQSLATKHLGAQIIKIESMSDYSCRNAYGRTKTKLSEHGRANALDIRGFVTAKGEAAYVLQGWGETERDVAARLLAAKQAEEKAAAVRAAAAEMAAERAKAAGTRAKGEDGQSKPPAVRSTIVEGTSEDGKVPALGVAPSQLGGPKAGPEPPARMRTFLREAHARACKIFGTTLGPEANNAHRNHFHVDMAPRARSNYCE